MGSAGWLPVAVALLAAGLEGAAPSGEDCKYIEGAIEKDGVCYCENPDYYIDGSGTKCIEVSFGGHGAPCQESLQCTRRMGVGGFCEGNACACAHGFHYLHGACWRNRAFGETCTVDAECYSFTETDAYACVEKVCACAVDAITIRPEPNPLCRRRAREGEECESNLDCYDNLKCGKLDHDDLHTICLSDTAGKVNGGNKTRLGTRSDPPSIGALSSGTSGSSEVKCDANEELTTNQTSCVCKRGYYRLEASLPCLPELGQPCVVGKDTADHIEYMTCRRSAKYEYAPPTPDEESEAETTVDNGEEETGVANGVWACLGGFAAGPTNRECVKVRQNAFNCTSDEQCSFYGGLCNSMGRCGCEEGYHYDSEGLVCWLTKQLHEVCTADRDCSVATADSAQCALTSEQTRDAEEPEGTCECKGGYREEAGDCKKEAHGLDEMCTSTADCVFANEDPSVQCIGSYCSCISGYYKSPTDNTKCLIGIGGPCQANNDCTPDNSLCSEVYTPEETTPAAATSDGPSSQGTSPATSTSEAPNLEFKCTCESGYVPGGAKACLKIQTEYGAECEVHDQCVPVAPDASHFTCDAGRCTCLPGYDFWKQQCWKNENCKYIEGATEGEDGECYCKNSDYFLDDSETRCLEVSFGGHGAPCQESLQCTRRMGVGGFCDRNACACADGFHYLHGACWRNRAYGEACTEDAECYSFAETDPYACVEGVCACAVDAITIRPEPNPLCRRRAREGEECESKLDCYDGLKCDKLQSIDLDFVCLVDTTSKINLGNKTRQRIRSDPPLMGTISTGASRLAEGECGDNEELTASQTCVCKRGYYRLKASLPCVPELGEPCVAGRDADDYIEYMSCRRSAKFEYAPPTPDESGETTTAISTAPTTPETAENEESEDVANGVWACLGGFVAGPSNRVCVKTRQNKYNCASDAQCGYYGALCDADEEQCECEAGYHYDSENLVCWLTKGLHETCTANRDCGVATADSVECVFSNAEETEGTCECKSGYREDTNDCKKLALGLGDRCTSILDCAFANGDPTVQCIGTYCSCISGYYQSPTDRTRCLIGNGGPCTSDSDCTPEYSQCSEESRCTCASGYVTNGARSCLKIQTEYGAECEEHDQCEPIAPDASYFTCYPTTSTCICWPGYHFKDKLCWITKYINEKCASPEQCVVENSICRKGYCTCDEGYVERDDKCEKGAASSITAVSVITLIFIVLANLQF